MGNNCIGRNFNVWIDWKQLTEYVNCMSKKSCQFLYIASKSVSFQGNHCIGRNFDVWIDWKQLIEHAYCMSEKSCQFLYNVSKFSKIKIVLDGLETIY